MMGQGLALTAASTTYRHGGHQSRTYADLADRSARQPTALYVTEVTHSRRGFCEISYAASITMALYDAFVSYSHTKDKPIAAGLQSVIQKLGKPWYRRRALRVFRDDTSLSATPHLWPTIEQALGQSRYFILLGSPEATASNWVNKEVAVGTTPASNRLA